MSRFPAVVALLALLGCRANIVAPTTDDTQGTVTGVVSDRFGNPAAGVEVRLYFDLIFESNTPQPERAWMVPDSLATVRVVVYDDQDNPTMELFRGTKPVGSYLATWSGIDSAGEKARSGIYTIRYMIGDSVCHTYVTCVDGGVVARTNAEGVYSIMTDDLPVGKGSIPIFSSDGKYFYGNHRIGSSIGLFFSSEVAAEFIEISIVPGSGKRLDLILQ